MISHSVRRRRWIMQGHRFMPGYCDRGKPGGTPRLEVGAGRYRTDYVGNRRRRRLASVQKRSPIRPYYPPPSSAPSLPLPLLQPHRGVRASPRRSPTSARSPPAPSGSGSSGLLRRGSRTGASGSIRGRATGTWSGCRCPEGRKVRCDGSGGQEKGRAYLADVESPVLAPLQRRVDPDAQERSDRRSEPLQR